MIASKIHRRGFTLLEVLLASVLAVVLLGALYAALNVTLVRMSRQRERLVPADLTRAITNRISNDLVGSLGLLQPGVNQSSSSSSGSNSGSASGASTTTGSSSSSNSTTYLPMQAGLIGTDQQLIIFSSRVPDVLNASLSASTYGASGSIGPTNGSAGGSSNAMTAITQQGQTSSDLRRVAYYLSPIGLGLCRQESAWATATGVWDTTVVDTSNEANDVIASEVESVLFEYFDGAQWQTTWDGSTTPTSGISTTYTGPPNAVRVTLTFKASKSGGDAKSVQYVVPLRTAFGQASSAAGTSTTTGTSSSTGTGSSNSTTSSNSGGK